MADLNVLGALSGISRGTLAGLKYRREEEQRIEEQKRQQRERRINLLRYTLPYMSKEQAAPLLDMDKSLGDDDKEALFAIAGAQFKEKGTPIEDTQKTLNNLREAMRKGASGDETYRQGFDAIIGTEMDASEKRLMIEDWKTETGLKTPKGFNLDQFLRNLQDPEIDSKGEWQRIHDQYGHKFASQLKGWYGGTKKQPHMYERPQPEEISPTTQYTKQLDVLKARQAESAKQIKTLGEELEGIKADIAWQKEDPDMSDDLEKNQKLLKEKQVELERAKKKSAYYNRAQKELTSRKKPFTPKEWEEFTNQGKSEIIKGAGKFAEEAGKGKQPNIEATATNSEGKKIYFFNGKWHEKVNGKWRTIK